MKSRFIKYHVKKWGEGPIQKVEALFELYRKYSMISIGQTEKLHIMYFMYFTDVPRVCVCLGL